MSEPTAETNDHFKNKNEAKDLAAVSTASADEAAMLELKEEVRQSDEKVKISGESTSAGVDTQLIIDDAIHQIMAEDIADYKDFHFPSIKLVVLYNRMQHEIKGRINTLGAKDDSKNTVKAYRSHHSKANDIKLLINLFHEIELQTERAKAIPRASAADIDEATEASMCAGPSRARELLHALYEEPTSPPATGMLRRERSLVKRVNSVKRTVRFKSTSPCGDRNETYDIKEED